MNVMLLLLIYILYTIENNQWINTDLSHNIKIE